MHRHAVCYQTDGAMLEFTRRIGIRVDIADFLQLQAALQRERIVEPAADEEAALRVDETAGQILDLLTIGQAGLDDLPGPEQLCRQAADLGIGLTFPGRKPAAAANR